ncbi:putative glycosyl hydrolase [Fusarium culmorum]|uniref:Putative glycosyl hydrolase n=1 Tax=Fusarium culmorum TaxID=5516 RepID=A0A2T4GKQ8_FUSCU|nr:putative glycosyl hydrolase [Fusarium culmorum]
MSSFRLLIEDGQFRDGHGRQVVLRGINLAADAKLPSEPDQPSHIPTDFFDGDNVSFHQRPFPKEDARSHFSRLRRYGFNTIRYIFTWEALEAAGPGKYDEDFIQHTIDILRIAKEYGFYIFMDPHQDVWSRFTGGSGAPLWTLYACGLNPQSFAATEAAIVHNTYPNPDEFPKMIWSTNYYRLAAGTIFTLFFAGKDFAPKCIIDGVNIQDYLQDHFMRACGQLAQRIHEAGDLEDVVVIGWESMNEPNKGMTGYKDLTVIPKEHPLKKGTCPTMWQTMLTGMGRACEVDTWEMGGLGPYKTGSTLVDPHGEIAWLPEDYDDSRYGWKRDPGWKLGQCIWAQHGVWDPETDTLLRKDYFAKNPHTRKLIDYPQFTNTYFMDFWRNTWNVDVVGVLRGKYWHPALAIRIGETAIRNCLRDQLATLRQEGLDRTGKHPCVLSEFGIPYDMDDKKAYKTGDYSSQSAAMDANYFAVEGSQIEGHCLWTYCARNDHVRGDFWNGEDLSILSLDDTPLPDSPLPEYSQSTLDLARTATATNGKKDVADDRNVTPDNLKRTLTNPSISSAPSTKDPQLTNAPGYRAAEAYVRPTPTVVYGDVVSTGFDLRQCTYVLKVKAPKAAPDDAPTIVFLPEYHFPKDQCDVAVSSGKWELSIDDEEGTSLQMLRWWHGEGEQSLKISGLVRKHNVPVGSEEDAGYLEQCQQGYGFNFGSCSVM